MARRAILAVLMLGPGCSDRPEPGGAIASAPAAPLTAAERTLSADPRRVLLEEGALKLEEQAWRWGELSGLAWLASTPLPGRAEIASLSEVVAFERLLPADAGPWAAINGGFYDPEGKAMGLVLSGGVERAGFAKGGGSGVFFMGTEGPRVVHRDAWQKGPTEALQSIDRIIDKGESLVHKVGPMAARSAVVVGAERLWLVALAEGVSIDSEPEGVSLSRTSGHGLPLSVFADYLVRETRAVEALNLDGAVSTQLAVRAGGKSFTVEGERGTINAVVLRP